MDPVPVAVAVVPSLRTSIGEQCAGPRGARGVPEASGYDGAGRRLEDSAFAGIRDPRLPRGPEVLEAVFESLTAGGCDLIGVMDHGGW